MPAHCLPARERSGLHLRIGIGSGPVVAGVIGRRRFLYDLWGDTVNMASRMGSHGLPGNVQIKRSTRELVRDEFECEFRGRVEVSPSRLTLVREPGPRRRAASGVLVAIGDSLSRIPDRSKDHGESRT